jgi:foldase protein PrsA
MSQSLRTALRAARGPRALVLLAAAAAIAGCGDNLSPSAVARVGDEPIEKSEFDHWLATAAASQQAALAPGGAQDAAAPVPPEFNDCVATKQEQASALEQAGGAQPATPSEDELRDQCEQEYELLKEQVMQFLIQAEAIEQEAEERDLSVSDEEVTSRLDDLKQQSFRSDEEYQRFLESSGMTEEDLLFRIRIDLLIAEIRDDVLAEEEEVSDEEVAAYYEENQDQPPIGQPEQREVRVVVTRNEEQATNAREALEEGDDFDAVAKKFSIDPASKNRGGKLTLQQGAEEEELDEAVFSAKVGELTGPVETPLGFYVFEVSDVRPGSTQTLEQSREAIVEILKTEQEQEALTEFQEQFDDEVREETVCAEEFTIVSCSNGPEPEEGPEEGAPVAPPAPPPAPGGAPPAPPDGGEGQP